MADQLPDPSGLQPASLMFGQVAQPDPIAKHASGMPSAVATLGPVPDEEAPMQQPNHPARIEGKPFSFALAHGTGGAQIWFGQFCATVTTSRFKRKFIGSREVHQFLKEDAIPNVTTHAPSNLNTDTRKTTHLGWYGDVYLYWEVSLTGEITACDVRGPDEPDGHNIAEINSAMVRTGGAGKYYILLGTVDSSSHVVQKISSDVHWSAHIISGESDAMGDIYDLDIEFYETLINFYDQTVTEVLTYVEYWRDGLYSGGYDPSESETAAPYGDENYPATTGTLRTRKVSHVTGSNEPG